jgi:cyclopropane fatty-acyl-phospholipid synthase-like methyltransferase
MYDGITSTEVFEHLWKPVDALQKLKSILKKDGILAIMTLFHPKNQDIFFDWFYIRDPSHVTFFTPKTFEVMAKKVGMTVIDTNDHRYITLKNS